MFLRRTARAPFVHNIAATATAHRVAIAGRRFASDYGSGTQYDGKNPSEHIEHPGPPPPSVAQGSGSNKQSKQDSGSEKQPAPSSSNEDEGESKGKKGPQPKILNESPPQEGQESQEVADHNKDMQNRADQAHVKLSDEQTEKDKVSKDFWKGHGGVDKDP